MGATAVIATLIYYIFQSLFSTTKNVSSKTSHFQESHVMNKLDVRNKQSIIDGIDYLTDIGKYEEALKLATQFSEYIGYDEDLEKRIKYINKKNQFNR